jgi:hypothetical protein
LQPESQEKQRLARGEIWTFLDDGYASKARPVVIVQGELGALAHCDSKNTLYLC